MQGDVVVSGLTKSFGLTTALSEVDLSSRKGINIVLGPNGAGKSTLLRCIDGLYKPDRGSVAVLGRDPYKDYELKKKLSIISDVPGLYDFLSVWDNIKFFGRLTGMPDNKIYSRARALLREMDALEYINAKVWTLSRGTKQKVAFCRTVLGEPDVLLMDEPTAFLDSKSSEYVRGMLQEYARAGKTAIFVTQKIDEVTRFNARILIMRKGRIVKDTRTEGLYNEALRKTYINVRLARPIPISVAQGVKGLARANSGSPTTLSLRVNNYRDINAALKYLMKHRAYIVSVDYVEPFIEELSFGER